MTETEQIHSAEQQAEAELSPQEARRRERAERIAYILNHSIYCTITDFLKPIINTVAENFIALRFLKKVAPGCGHDHSGEDNPHPHDHDHHHPPVADHRSRWGKIKDSSKTAFSKERFIRYVKGEAIGDIGAIPVTIILQDMFPKLVPAIRKISEPIMGPVFRFGVKRSVNKWAKASGVEIGSEAYNAKANELYEYEMQHFPQAVLWTGSAIVLNTSYQMWADRKSNVPFAKNLGLKTSTVLSGMLITSGVVVGTRAMMPEKMHNLDQSNVQKAILPITKWTGKLFGVREEDVNRMMEKEQKEHGHSHGSGQGQKEVSWEQKVSNNQKQSQYGLAV